MPDTQGQSAGPSTDRHNEPVIDPTKNVLDLVAAETKRQDDMREGFEKRVIEMIELRADYDEKLRKAESDRIDAIRAVDVGNVQRAAEVQATQALALANQVVATANALETKLSATVAPLQTRIDDLTRVQYEGVGSKGQQQETREVGASTGLWIGIAIAGLGLLLTFIGIAITAIVVLTQ